MRTKRAGLGGALIVSLVVFGLAVIVGIIFWLMLAPSGIQHSPRQAVPSSWIQPPGPADVSLSQIKTVDTHYTEGRKVTLVHPAHI